MVIIQQDDSPATYNIQRYEPGKIWINGQFYQNSVIIRPHELLVPWLPHNMQEITASHFTPLYEKLPHILLFGTGAKLIIPSTELMRELQEKGIGVEFMDSKAACYTYTVLAAELRDVAACILIE